MFELDGEGGVQNIARRHALVDKAGIGADGFRQIGEESQNVVAGDFFDFVDAGDFPFALFPDILGGRGGDNTQFRQSVAGMGFDFEPDAEAVVRCPDGGHFRAGITGDHG